VVAWIVWMIRETWIRLFAMALSRCLCREAGPERNRAQGDPRRLDTISRLR